MEPFCPRNGHFERERKEAAEQGVQPPLLASTDLADGEASYPAMATLSRFCWNPVDSSKICKAAIFPGKNPRPWLPYTPPATIGIRSLPSPLVRSQRPFGKSLRSPGDFLTESAFSNACACGKMQLGGHAACNASEFPGGRRNGNAFLLKGITPVQPVA